MSFPNSQHYHRKPPTPCFNPCFSGCLSRTRQNLQFCQSRYCFNPCFSGCLSRTSVFFLSLLFLFKVSILVLVDVFPEPELPPPFLFLPVVSILVLVDVFPEPGRYITVSGFTDCFNPCFSGCLSRTMMSSIIPLMISRVSILVLVDVFPEPRETRLHSLFHLWFQSLF